MRTHYQKRRSLTVLLAVAVFFLDGGQKSSSLLAGIYTLNSKNYEDTATWCSTCIDTGSNITVEDGGFFITTSSTSATITISGLKIKRGQKWSEIRIGWTRDGDSGSISAVLSTKSGDALNGDGSTFEDPGTSVISMKPYENRTGADDLTLTLNLNKNGGATPKIISVKAAFSGNNVILFPSPFSPAQGRATIKLDLDSKAVVTLSIFDSRNYLVKRIFENKSFSGFDTPREGIRVFWNGKNSNGTLVPSGIYSIVATVEENGGVTSSSRFRFLLVR